MLWTDLTMGQVSAQAFSAVIIYFHVFYGHSKTLLLLHTHFLALCGNVQIDEKQNGEFNCLLDKKSTAKIFAWTSSWTKLMDNRREQISK